MFLIPKISMGAYMLFLDAEKIMMQKIEYVYVYMYLCFWILKEQN